MGRYLGGWVRGFGSAYICAYLLIILHAIEESRIDFPGGEVSRMGWDGMGWDGMGWDEMRCDVMLCYDMI